MSRVSCLPACHAQGVVLTGPPCSCLAGSSLNLGSDGLWRASVGQWVGQAGDPPAGAEEGGPRAAETGDDSVQGGGSCRQLASRSSLPLESPRYESERGGTAGQEKSRPEHCASSGTMRRGRGFVAHCGRGKDRPRTGRARRPHELAQWEVARVAGVVGTMEEWRGALGHWVSWGRWGWGECGWVHICSTRTGRTHRRGTGRGALIVASHCRLHRCRIARSQTRLHCTHCMQRLQRGNEATTSFSPPRADWAVELLYTPSFSRLFNPEN
jgi:hypothetical protein